MARVAVEQVRERERVVEMQAFRFAKGVLDRVGRQNGGKIEDGAGNGGDRNPRPGCDLVCGQYGEVSPYALA